MELDAVHAVVETWARQTEELGRLDWIRHVEIFENHGAALGTSNAHAHGQIWAQETLPNEMVKELRQRQFFAQSRGTCLLCSYLDVELTQAERVVSANDSFVAVVPYWAVWPFDTLVLPRRHGGGLFGLSADERRAFADILRRLTRGYDQLFDTPFPYSMGLHQRPMDENLHPEWHFHVHFYPPLLRSATIRKFMVGYELLCQPQRDITPEVAASRLTAAVLECPTTSPS